MAVSDHPYTRFIPCGGNVLQLVPASHVAFSFSDGVVNVMSRERFYQSFGGGAT